MTDRAQAFMNAIWEARNSGADTEEKLIAAVLRITADAVQFYNAQNDLIVLDKNDMLQLAQELEQ
jgi:homogentisate 1,2-dioxygenase